MSRTGGMPCFNQGGFTYLFVLLTLMLLALMLMRSQEAIQIRHQQHQEEELLFRGEQIIQAISQYRSVSHANGCYPVSFEQLLTDRRGQKVHYHLRRWYVDPFTGSSQWGMVYDPQGRWLGVQSQGHGLPLRKEGFGYQVDANKFKQAKDYQEWVFAVAPDPTAPLPAACENK